MAGRLEGKIAIVTGAGSVGDGWGNGRATAHVFAREGARVLAVDRDPEPLMATLELIAEAGGIAEGHTCDVTDTDQVREMVAAAKDTFGGLDVLVNNVGGSKHGGPTDLDEADWRAQLDLNLTSVYLGCRHAIPAMRERGAGAIVNLASTSGMRFTGSPQVAYAAAKAAIIQLSKVTAVEHVPGAACHASYQLSAS
jgi:NAD(P)-dependent dehydrogenase (short-subunit alcohol dehydrogenase family)